MEKDCRFLVVPQQLHQAYAAAVDDGQFLQQLSGGDGEAAGRGAGGGERKRRFTEEQVRSLETTFHARHAKLEPREKAELARELGLQPRQVAIWFQNKRARWRSKQLEQDFAALRAEYDALHDRVELLKQEKLTLTAQLGELREKLNERQDQSGSCDGAEGDDKRNNVSSCLVEEDEAADASDDLAEGGYDHLAYVGGLPEPFCATPELWDAWPLVEWNAVA